ncbi:glycosyltransferase [Micromonospora purpureochromogenes]|uniref:Cellulose synthase/poly-beta-1,6-N-acetylglucosamine synthase-like glycosyltransferase/putative flippase GtrA n=1 Tax=Micromonospora purpureochromogenes TaxID=47872 RepID=A0ABX2RSH0_9ACTN|nr:glycosyltransferase [Micromonospora purpureochromogenes]NYF59490.1 cellulose synthase/poly-beta-1,6-N-acetylglucosamine synthase-like glycosyltransferase/putative flippase GtrA [Micromonospora purpureochromogenes]
MRTVIGLARRREPWLFLTIGAAVAVVGHVVLHLLIGRGVEPAVANAVQLAFTLQLSFVAHDRLTWRRRTLGRPAGRTRRWWRFQTARGASALLSLVAFPFLAPVTGTTAAYWGLLAAGTVVNYCSDHFWSFSHKAGTPMAAPATRPRYRGAHRRPLSTGWRLARLAGALAVLCVPAVLFLDVFVLVVSLFMLVVAVTTLAFQLYKWWLPEHNDPDRYGQPDEPRLPGVILVPMRHEEAVAGHTLERLANLDHPDYWVVPIIDHPDDPGTAAIAHATAARYPGRVLVAPYPEDTDVHNKPIGLNAAVRELTRLGVRYEWIGIADAEDLFHPALLRMVDYRFRRTGAGIVQCGVQLMNFSADPRTLPLPAGRLPRLRRWWRANSSGWWRAANVLEYYKWFQSRLKLQAATKVMPLGGNTVFFRREFLEALRKRYGAYWDEDCLTEDCKIGMVASVLGYDVDVVYIDEMVTREETPDTLRGLVRQRVRWMQGFIQVFTEREWLALPRLWQKILAVYVLGFQFFQAFSVVFAPVALALALTHKSPIVVALLASVPLGISLLTIALDVLMLHQFGRTFGQKVRLRDHLGVVLGGYPYQVVLSVAAVWALLRHVSGRTNWVKTAHSGAHLGAAPAGDGGRVPATAGVGA